MPNKPLMHPELHTYFENPKKWEERFLTPELRSKNWDLYANEEMSNIFTIPAFTEEFCDFMIEEAEASNEWTVDRHEFYPTTDMVLQVIGMHNTYHQILKEFVWPMAAHLFKLEEPAWTDMTSENFLARYHPYAQYHLSLHHDMSQITTVVTLNEDFEGGGTYFSKQKTRLQGLKGHISVHPGQITHRHGGLPVKAGQRYILVSFCNLKK